MGRAGLFLLSKEFLILLVSAVDSGIKRDFELKALSCPSKVSKKRVWFRSSCLRREIVSTAGVGGICPMHADALQGCVIQNNPARVGEIGTREGCGCKGG